MDAEVAARLAAMEVEGITAEQARTLLDAYKRALALCSVCAGKGTITFGHPAHVKLTDNIRRGEEKYIPQGTEATCPHCVDPAGNDGYIGDPDFVAWHCTRGQRDVDCRNDLAGAEDRRTEHQQCGWRLMLPFDPA